MESLFCIGCRTDFLLHTLQECSEDFESDSEDYSDHDLTVTGRSFKRQSLAGNPRNMDTPKRMFPLSKAHWVPDGAVDRCQRCQKKFNVIRRKHHCRACGHIFCSQCSKYLRRGFKVCYDCHRETIQVSPSVWKGSLCLPAEIESPFQSIYNLYIEQIFDDKQEWSGEHSVDDVTRNVRGRWNRLEDGTLEIIYKDKKFTMIGVMGSTNKFEGEIRTEGVQFQKHHRFSLQRDHKAIASMKPKSKIWEIPVQRALVELYNVYKKRLDAGLIARYAHSEFNSTWVLMPYVSYYECPSHALVKIEGVDGETVEIQIDLQPKRGFLGNEELGVSIVYVSHKRNLEITSVMLDSPDDVPEHADLVVFQNPQGFSLARSTGKLIECDEPYIKYECDSLYENCASFIFHDGHLLACGLNQPVATSIGAFLEFGYDSKRILSESRCILKAFRPNWEWIRYCSIDPDSESFDIGCRKTYTEDNSVWSIVVLGDGCINLQCEALQSDKLSWFSVSKSNGLSRIVGSATPANLELVPLGLGFYFLRVGTRFVGLNPESMKTLANILSPTKQFVFGLWEEHDITFRLIFRLDSVPEVLE